MPYIKRDDREQFEESLKAIPPITSAGELNYFITRACQRFLVANGQSYSTYNAIIGVLECAKLELYRRKVAAYEDGKIAENGDVY